MNEVGLPASSEPQSIMPDNTMSLPPTPIHITRHRCRGSTAAVAACVDFVAVVVVVVFVQSSEEDPLSKQNMNFVACAFFRVHESTNWDNDNADRRRCCDIVAQRVNYFLNYVYTLALLLHVLPAYEKEKRRIPYFF